MTCQVHAQTIRKWNSQILKITQWKRIKASTARDNYLTQSKTTEHFGRSTSVWYFLRKIWSTSFIAVPVNSNRDGRGTITTTWVCNVRKEKIIGKQNIFDLTGSFLFQPITFLCQSLQVNKKCESFCHLLYAIYSRIKKLPKVTNYTGWKQTNFSCHISTPRNMRLLQCKNQVVVSVFTE